MTLAMFLPCRAGSERVKRKNTRPFAGVEGGLLAVKLAQLEAVDALDVVILDSNDPEVLAIGAAKQRAWRGRGELVVRARPDALGASSTTTDALIAYALATVECDTLAWTHVTSPLCDTSVYATAIAAFRERDAAHDSLMAVTPLRTFLWRDGEDGPSPANYAPEPLRWPRTQDLAPLYEVNSALFVVPRAVGVARRDRIGERPILHVLDKITAADVDWEEDFALAESLFATRRDSHKAARSEAAVERDSHKASRSEAAVERD
jgi:CMP-N-acetylneuraminic acid synthetase